MHPAPVDSPFRPRTVRPATAAAVSGALSALLLVLVAVRWGPLMSLDLDVARALHGPAVSQPGLTRVHRVLTDWPWDPWAMRALCAAAVAWLAWRRRARLLALWLAVTCAVGTLVQQALKAAVDRPRPVWPDPVDSAHFAAYPSGHAMTATVVCGLLLWVLRLYGAGPALWRTALAVAAVSVLGVGFTRVWLGVHWPSDVVGGWLLGVLTVALSVAAYERWGAGRG